MTKKQNNSLLALAPLLLWIGACQGEHKQDHGTHAQPHFSYGGDTGPEHWGDLSEDWQLAKTGRKQSPIDLRAGAAAPGDSAPELSYLDTPLDIINNEHTVQVNYTPGSTMSINEEPYELKQFHFHTPSEHTLDGESTPMELHLVHSNASGELAVLGLMIVTGEENATLAKFWDRLPEDSGATARDEGLVINIGDLLPEDRSSFQYSGSLTTPPCSEDVSWTVLRTPIHASDAQVETLHAIIGNNARPVQPLNDRSLVLAP